MMRSSFLTLTTLFGLLPLVAEEPKRVSFSRDIQPLFAERCLECHGPDKQKGKLRVDSSEDVHRVISEDEFLYRITTDDPDDRMPPEGPSLTDAEVEQVRNWIETGARFEKHWAYRPLKEDPLPSVKDDTWIRNPIDQFVLARLEKEGIAPSPEADRYTLIKRLSYDLLGLPPSLEEVEAFVKDESPDAYANLVRRLLDSPHFGERWGRHWLDKARYADSDGYEKDRPRPNAWHYRDWVINAVNADMPLDQFTAEQLAGDLLPDATEQQRLATAFHRQTLTNTEGGTDKEEFRTEAVFDRTETTGTVWLGLTLNCARCHSHKYDTIEQSEYFQLYAFFNNGDEANFNLPHSQEAMEKYREEKAAYDQERKELQSRIEEASEGHESSFAKWSRDVGEKAAAKDTRKSHPISLDSVESSVDGMIFNIGNDDTILVSGANPDGVILTTVRARASANPEPITRVRLEVLPDPALPARGPGLAPNGNFVLNEIEVFSGEEKLKIRNAVAAYSQPKFDAKKLIDGSTDRSSGWAVGGKVGQRHEVDLILDTPLSLPAEQALRIVLTRNYTGGHTVGKFRISLVTGNDYEKSIPEAIRKILLTEEAKRTGPQKKELKEHFLANVHDKTRTLIAERTKLEKSAPKEPVTPIAVIRQRTSEIRETRILERGSFLTPGDAVEPAGLSLLPPIPARSEGATPDRLDLANWLMSEANPLTPRVLANQAWEKLFGEGLVRTMNDFGVRGDLPDHPELLDWLASEYRRLGWSRKRFIETIVTSATYRQESAHRDDLLERDPNNRLLARQNRFRVEAETVRDVSLAVSGLLSSKVGGPSVYPPMPPEVAALSYANNFKWTTSKGEDRYRRGMYTFFKRTSPHPNLIAFDCPDSNTTNVKRRTSNTPIQALTLLNNETFIEAARAFALRVLSVDAKSDDERIEHALRLCIARPPVEEEVREFRNLLDTSRGYYLSQPEEARKLLGDVAAKAADHSEAAAWVAVARIALNLDEVITRE